MENERIDDEFEKLMNRIYRTWHARIKTANRLLRISKTLEILYEYYTVSLTVLSVYSLVVQDGYAGYLSTVLSIAAMGIAFCGNNMNLKERYKNVMNNYIKLDKLYYKSVAVKKRTHKIFSEISNEYTDILNECENHSTDDFVCASLEDKEKRKEISVKQRIMFYFHRTVSNGFILLLYAIPTIVIAYSLIKYFLA